MPGIHFDITAGDSGFVSKINEVSSSVSNAQRELKAAGSESTTYLGKIADLSHRVAKLQDNINEGTAALEEYSRKLTLAFEQNDTAGIEKLNKEILETAQYLDDLKERSKIAHEALKDVSEIAGISIGSRETNPYLFKSYDEYIAANELTEKKNAIQTKIGAFDTPDDELKALRTELHEIDSKLIEMKSRAADAATSLGANLGAKAAEASKALYDLNDKIKAQQNYIVSLQEKMSSAKEELDLAKNSNANADAIENITEKLAIYKVAITDAEAKLKNLKAAQIDAQAEWDSFGLNKPDIPPIVTSPKLYSSEADYHKANELHSDVSSLKSQIANFSGSDEDLQKLKDSLSEAEGELQKMETAAADAAAKLGTELGSKAVEASSRLYELDNSIIKQKETVKTLSNAVDEASKELEKLKESEADASAIETAQAKVDALTNSLTNAQNELRNTQAAQQDAKTKWAEVSVEVERHESTLVKMLGGYDKYTQIMSQLPGPIQGVVSSITGMTGAAKAFLATPLGIALGAILLVLQSLKTWFNETTEGQLAFAEISGYVSGVLDSLKMIIAEVGKTVYKVGKAIFSAFSDPKKAVEDLWGAIQKNIVNRLNGLTGIFSHLGKAISNIFDSNASWADVGRELKEVANSTIAVATGVDSALDKIGGAIRNTHNNALLKAEISKQEKLLDMEVHQWGKRKAEIEKIKAEAQAKMYDSSQSPAARKKAMADFEKALDEQYAKEEEFARKRINLHYTGMSVSNTDIEDENHLADLEAEKKRLEAQKAREIASLQRRKNSINTAESRGENAEQKKLEAQQKLNDALEKLRDENAKNEIAQMEEGQKKTLAMIEANYRARLTALEKQSHEMARANKKAGVTDVDEAGLTAEQAEALNKAKQLNESERRKLLDENRRAELAAYRDYLRDFGTFQQQKLAIAEDYAEKIAAAQRVENTLEVKRLEKERDSAMSQVDISKLTGEIDWSQSFAGIGNVLRDMAKETLVKVDEYMRTDDYKKLDATNKKAYADFAKQLRAEVGETSNPFNFKIWGEIQTLTTNYRDSVARFKAATDAHTAACDELTAAQEELANATSLEARQEAEGRVRMAQIRVNATANDVNSARNDKDSAGQALTNATNKASLGLQNFAANLNEISNGSLYGFANGITKFITSLTSEDGVGQALGEIGGKIGGIIGAALTLLDAMGDAPAEFTKDLFDKVTVSITESLAQLPQIIVEVFKGAGNMVAGVFSGFSQMFGFSGESDPTLERDTERLTASNEALRKAIEGLTDEMSDVKTYQLPEVYKAQIENLKQVEANTKEMMQRSGDAYNGGFLGMGGHHSSNDKINKALNNSDWARISKAAGTSVSSAAQFFRLTSEQMNNVATIAPEMYAKIKALADDGYKDAAQYMDEYIAFGKEFVELEKQYKETLTDVSFDSVRDDFKSLLLDMSSDSEDFSNNFSKMLQQAVIEGMMKNEFNDRLQDWYDAFVEHIEDDGTLDYSEQNQLSDIWNTIVNDALTQRNQLRDAMGWGTATESQSSTGGYSTQLSEDTGTLINGRLTAMQDSNERIAQTVVQGLLFLQSISVANTETNSILSDILTQSALANIHLSDIVKYTKEINRFGDKLDKIILNTKDL